MSDDEDYNSEEDFDYVPSDGEQVSEEENSGDEEDLSVLQDGESDVKLNSRRQKPAGKKKKAEISARQRKGGIKLDENDASTDDQANNLKAKEAEESEEELKRKKELADQMSKEDTERKQEKEKKRADDLWASFMTDVKKPTKPATATSPSSGAVGSGLGSLSSTQVKPSSVQKKVTITKVFDFAGEEVKVTKEVDANSKEAQAEKVKQVEKTPVEKKVTSEMPESSSTPLSLQASLKRPGSGGLGSVLNKIGKKSKIGTLEKSKLDWEGFKSKEGIKEDLAIHNKGKQGYTERMAFLNRTDHRQFEIEKDLRLGTNSKR